MMADQVHKNARLYAPPWRDVMPDGTLGPEYGPKSAAGYARLLVDFKLGIAPPQRSPAQARDLDRLRAWIRLEDGTLRLDVPRAEAQVFLGLEQGLGLRAIARQLGLSRETVRSYLRRLRARRARWTASE